VYFRGTGWLTTPSFARAGLTPGMRLDGPAVVEQDDATPLVAPGFRARVDAADNLILERSP
jgi:N-methylhydantoinase A